MTKESKRTGEVSRSIKFSKEDILAIEYIKKHRKIRTGTEVVRQSIHRDVAAIKAQKMGV